MKGKSIIINNNGETKNGYVDITITMMALLGSKISRTGSTFISTEYQPRDITINIPSDFTSLSYTLHLSSCLFIGALTHPGHIVLYAPGDSLLCRRDASRNP